MDFPRLSAERRNSLAEAATRYNTMLSGSPVISYLEQRGIPASVADGAQLGYVANAAEGHEHVVGRLSIPYRTPTGIVDIRFRTLDSAEPTKYLSLPGAAPHLFNVGDLHVADSGIAICEGELDTLVMSKLCGIPAVGIPGDSFWGKSRPWLARVFADFDPVYVVMDWTHPDGTEDKAGRDAAKRIKRDVGESAVLVALQAGDVTETYLKEGRDSIRTLLGLTDAEPH